MLPAVAINVSNGLEIIGGKYAAIQTSRTKPPANLVVKTSQTNETDLTVYRVPVTNYKVHMAFCFKIKDKYYYPVVEQNSDTKTFHIKVEGPIEKSFDNFPDRFLFQWNGSREYGSLGSVLADKHYLCVSDKMVILTSKQEFIFKRNAEIHAHGMASRRLCSINSLVYGIR
ncbi:hypothetical protein HF521_014777 [Silurus meridionalis]|uniref:Uncharacterized protein n=1 Tax=Silurus meridionalis TaxID=175797 RepID=A0A8T0A8H3_SILME|nr:hypothetical protein HF521_014777 [Silurus meridionalis]